MTYAEAFELYDTQKLKSVVEKTNQLLPAKRSGSDTTPLFYDDNILFHRGLNFIWSITSKISDGIRWVLHNLQDIWIKLKSLADRFWDIFGRISADWFWDMFQRLKGFTDRIGWAWREFVADPFGKIYEYTQRAVRPLINGIKTVSINVWDIANKVANAVSGTIQNIVDYAKNTIISVLYSKFSDVFNWVINAKNTVINEIKLDLQALKFLPGEFKNTTVKLSQASIEEIKAGVSAILKTFDFGLGGVADAIIKGISNLFDTGWDWFTSALSKMWNFVSSNFLSPLWDGAVSVFNWLWAKVQNFFSYVLNLAKRTAPRAPEQGDSLIWEGVKFLGLGGAILAGMMLAGGLAKRVAGADIPYLGAIFADFAGFQYITGAVMGGLITASYAQPLKYYYNALFRPYLPSWSEAREAFGRNKISDSLFKFFMKYHGLPEKYLDMYRELAARPISSFLIRYIADAELVDPRGIFEICMDNGYRPSHSQYLATAMSWGANASYRRAVESILKKCYKEGFISKDEFDKYINQIRTRSQVVATYKTVDGYTISATVEVPIDQKTLLKMSADWEAFYDSMQDKLSALKSAYSKEQITEEEFRNELKKIIKVDTKIEDIVQREKAKKRTKTEPERGKTLRQELKTVLKNCYKEGFITASYLQKLLDDYNKVVDEKTLIKERANWEAFYDDMKDLVAIYKENLENGVISEEVFRRDLLDMGLRPDKIELMIQLIQAKKAGRIKQKS